MNVLTPVISRIIAGLVGTLAAYLETKYQVVIAPDTKQALVAGGIGTFGIVYPLVHRILDRWLNPGDAASSHLGAVEKAQAETLKTAPVTPIDPNYPR